MEHGLGPGQLSPRTRGRGAHPQVELLRHQVARERRLQRQRPRSAQLRQRAGQRLGVAVGAHGRLRQHRVYGRVTCPTRGPARCGRGQPRAPCGQLLSSAQAGGQATQRQPKRSERRAAPAARSGRGARRRRRRAAQSRRTACGPCRRGRSPPPGRPAAPRSRPRCPARVAVNCAQCLVQSPSDTT